MLHWLVVYRLDALLLVAFCVGVVAPAGRVLRRTPDSRRYWRTLWRMALPVLLVGVVGAEISGRRERARLQRMIEGFAPTYAHQLSVIGHARLPDDAAADDPLYLALVRTQVEFLKLNPPVNDIYTMRRRADGTVAFLVDSETDYDGNGRYDAEREQRTPMGEVFPESSATLHKAFEGVAVFDADPVTDRWGTWVSAYSPMYGADGRVEAVLGVDYAASEWLRSIALHRSMPLAAAACVIGTLAASAGVVSVLRREIAKREQVERKLRHDFHHDALTGLPNRILFGERLGAALARLRRESADRFAEPAEPFAVLFLDLDRFKTINDSLGHAAGDELLRATAERLREAAGATGDGGGDGDGGARSNMVARMSGDEFTILLEAIPSGVRVEPFVREVADRVLATLGAPFVLGGLEAYTSASVGIAVAHAGYRDVAELVRDADAAMYRAKSAGKACAVVFEPSMHQAAYERLSMERDLRHAAAEGQLVLHYQPIVMLQSRRIVGFEALLRWNHPKRGMLPPGEFIPLAEETGLINELGLWVLRSACEQLRAWHREFPDRKDLSVSVNLSARQLREPRLVEQVREVLETVGVDPSRVVLELTESAVVETEDAERTLGRLKALGVKLHLDDFGSGYSSFGCLHRYPLDGVKIDRSFVQLMEQRRDYAAVIHAIVTLARNLGFCLVAEGLETADQAAMLQAMDCEQSQGFFFSRPVPVEGVRGLLIGEGEGVRRVA